ncbi:MAG: methionyl-tRNA formyltransferase, partial [Lutibacter sp.]|nr:methionyl-tRNA formyltransferase [Lutibacter sp.]
ASHHHKNGTLITSKNEIKVAVTGGYIILESLQLAGKKQMDSKSLLNGFKFSENALMQ